MQDNPLHTQDNPEYAKGYLAYSVTCKSIFVLLVGIFNVINMLASDISNV